MGKLPTDNVLSASSDESMIDSSFKFRTVFGISIVDIDKVLILTDRIDKDQRITKIKNTTTALAIRHRSIGN